ncbi:MAG: extracellular solute-binding protein [Bacilli bacterium]|nr:extracellular solute-binding protein [Bacilli bacterium]
MKRKFNFNIKMIKKGLWLFLLTLLLTAFTVVVVQSFNPNHISSKSMAPSVLIPDGSYKNFLKMKQGIQADALDDYELNFDELYRRNMLPQLDNDIIVAGTGAVASDNADGFGVITINDANGENVEAYKTTESGFATWTIPNIPQAGLYQVYVNYFPLEQGGANIERRIIVNQKINTDISLDYPIQYDDLINIKFPRYWHDKDAIIQDIGGNDMKPRQEEILDVCRTQYIRDYSGYVVEPYLLYFNKGENTITFESIREAMAIVAIGINSYQPIITYQEYRNYYAELGYSEISSLDDPIRVEGEDAKERTSPTLYAISDRTNPKNNPVDPVKIKLNAIGGSKWSTPGDAITWEVDMTNHQSGLYNISFRSKQDTSRGLFSTRRVYINGNIPFIEANSAKFAYSSEFKIVTLGSEDEPFGFYLEGGKVNTITLEATLGDYSEQVNKVQKVVDKLNNLYIRIIAVTTVNPDPYQNYHLYGDRARVEGTLETLKESASLLEQVSENITKISGEKSDKVAVLDKMSIQLWQMYNRPRTIQQRLKDFARNLSALGTWISDIKEQALTIECLWVHTSLKQLPKANANFFSGTWFDIKAFVRSFSFKYELIGKLETIDSDKNIEVWFLTSAVAGREQANAINTLMANTFTHQYGINVDLKVVSPSVLLSATLAGIGPDVAINVDNGLPVNYAMRKAVMDVSGFPEFYEVTGICSAKNAAAGLCDPNVNYNQGRLNEPEAQYLFFDSAMVPYEYDGGYYALPNTQSFLVMFYRTDIFAENGWIVPETWDDVTSLVTELSISNLKFYLPISTVGASSYVNPVFATMLYQRGGSFYRNGNRESNFDTEQAMRAFEVWCRYYTDYGFSLLVVSFLNRFRTGEMPIGIAGYELFNTLTVFAPEIAGKWTFAPLPGFYNEKDEYSNRGAVSGTAVVMLKQTKREQDYKSAWDFMRWWVSKDIQTSYARELESILGAAARHNTANVLSFQNLAWTREEREVLIEQWSKSVGVPEVPGGYYTGRNLENAFREVVNSDTNPRETLQEYIILINAEIRKKRKEFGLD